MTDKHRQATIAATAAGQTNRATGAVVSAIGGSVGVVAALLASRLLASQLHGVPPHDAATFGAVFAVLLLVALAASYIPARRATRIDPQECLKSE